MQFQLQHSVQSFAVINNYSRKSEFFNLNAFSEEHYSHKRCFSLRHNLNGRWQNLSRHVTVPIAQTGAQKQLYSKTSG